MHKLTRGIASASARHPWRTITAWLAVTGAVFFLATAAGGTFVDDFSSPGSQSATALELLDENFPEAAKGSAMVVFAAHDGTTLDEHQDEIADVLDDTSKVARVESLTDPFAAGTISEDRRIGFSVMTLDSPERQIGKPAFAVLSEAVAAEGSRGLQVELGGDAVFRTLRRSSRRTPRSA
jgi:RND superfamily putative drug exporter